jgi:interferon gamma-inducible protein 30
MTPAGRLSTLLVACILIRGIFFQTICGIRTLVLKKNHHPSWTVDATLRGTTTHIHSFPAVQVTVFVEALCIDSKRYFNEQLVSTYDQLGSQVMDLNIVVFGNARINLANKTVQCQHGEAECDANSYDQCAVDIYPYPDRYLPYMTCLFNSLPMGRRSEPYPTAVFASCARHAALDAQVLQQCHDDPERVWELQKQTAAMNPSELNHVPWVELNGAYMDEEQTDLLTGVCQLYIESGGLHPACGSHVEAEAVSVRVA